ncbi:MAG: VTT domain-containing protein [Candidatus Campbellbacteria bacterium]|nr:VTT domain-containing protein [Candidatus Campbellbacteria bacterium]
MRVFRLLRQSRLTKKELTSALFVVTLFALALLLSYKYGEQIENLVFLDGPLGMLLYFLLSIASVVLAPMAVIPFIPLAVKIWGSLPVALLSVSGWTAGAMIAYYLARKYGRPFVAKFISISAAEATAKKIVGKRTFLPVLISRVIFPADAMSYVIGLFVPIRFVPYSVATLIGVSPMAFALAFGVSLPLIYQAIAIVFVLVFLLAVFFITRDLGQKKDPIKEKE